MSTWTQLTEELTVSERRKTSARLKAEEKALLEEERLKMVEKKRQELIEAHEKAKQEAIDEFEEQMSNLNDKMDQETTEARKACAQAEERTRVANELTMKADMKAQELKQQIKKLHIELEAARCRYEQRFEEVRDKADEAVHKSLEDTSRAVRGMAIHANDVQEDALTTLEAMQREALLKMHDAEEGATRRSKFDELHNIVLSHSRKDTTKDHFDRLKGELIQDWYDKWVDSTATLVLPPCSPPSKKTIPISERQRPKEAAFEKVERRREEMSLVQRLSKQQHRR